MFTCMFLVSEYIIIYMIMHVYVAPEPGNPVLRCCTGLKVTVIDDGYTLQQLFGGQYIVTFNTILILVKFICKWLELILSTFLLTDYIFLIKHLGIS